MTHKAFTLAMVLFVSSLAMYPTNSQTIPDNSLLGVDNLTHYLKPEVLKQLAPDGTVSEAELAEYFRSVFSKRFFYNWQNADSRFKEYNQLYNREASHRERALDHLSKFPDSTQWLLPFNYKNGEAVNAYALRHLARQHKMVDIAYLYFYQDKDPKYIRYFTRQMQSLNTALAAGKYERIEDGNGIYEVYRSGYRILNWLTIHNLFLGDKNYSDADQLYTIATLLQHASHLYTHNEKFHSGNHQTRGMSALAMLSILFHDFEDADLWYERSMRILGEHLEKEINADGFQFERSVHYHMSDIANYFYVYQLTKIGNIRVDAQWESQLKSLFTTLTKIAYPDKSAPVLQDDTDDPWAEKNEISGTVTLGYLLFDDPSLGYFANPKVSDRMYWFLNKKQLTQLENIQTKLPQYGSLDLPETGYYIMREGWKPEDNLLIISAGLDDKKPDHQHGDMLGIQAMSNGKVLLPNYQVRYSLKDYQWFKNSMVKSVALVDDQLQGKQYSGNTGGSGFGKFKELPNPTTIAWKTTENIDLYVGKHDGFENDNVGYSRQVLFINKEFWIVKDNFYSEKKHNYKQIWQGHYSTEHSPQLLRSTFDNGSGFDIMQLGPVDNAKKSGKNGKEWMVVRKDTIGNFSFITLLFPYPTFEHRLNEENPNRANNWLLNSTTLSGNFEYALSNHNQHLFFGIRDLKLKGTELKFERKSDVYLSILNEVLSLSNIGDQPMVIHLKKDKKQKSERLEIAPGEKLSL